MKIVHCKYMEEYMDEIEELKDIYENFIYPNKGEELFLLKSDRNKIYGYALVSIKNEIPLLKKIYIIPTLRNNGYGTILLNNIIEWIIGNEYDKLIVEEHRAMNNFLEKQRFIKVNEVYELSGLLEYKREEKTLLFISKFAIFVNILLAILKISAGIIFNSMSLTADGINSISDLVTNVLVILGLKIGRNIGDKEHPFGHGKVESIFSVIIGTFIIITAVDVIRDNILVGNKKIIVNEKIILITIFALFIKILQFLFMKYKTKKYKQPLINSLLKDYKSDILITFSVVISIFLSSINPFFDKLIGILVGFNIIKTGYDLIKENALILMDSQDEELLESIKGDILQIEDVKNAHDFKMTTAGKDIFIIMDIRIEGNKTVEEGHNLANFISKKIKEKYKNIKEVIIHIEPVYNIEQ